MAIIFKDSVLALAFENCQMHDHWLTTIRACLGEELRFDATLSKSPLSLKLTNDEVCVFIHKGSICLTTRPTHGQPPKYLTSWRLCGMQHFGILNGQYCIEVADEAVCGTFILDTEHAVQMDIILKEMTCGQLGRKRSLSSSSCCSHTEAVPMHASLSSALTSSMSRSGDTSNSKGETIYAEQKSGETDGQSSETDTDLDRKSVTALSIIGNEGTAWKVPAKSGAWLSNHLSTAGQNIHCFDLKLNDVKHHQKNPLASLQKTTSNLPVPEHSITYQQSTFGSSRYFETAEKKCQKQPDDYFLLHSSLSFANKQLSNLNKSDCTRFTSDGDQNCRQNSYSNTFSSCIKYFIGSLASHKFNFSRSLSLLCCSSVAPKSSCLHKTHSDSNIQHSVILKPECMGKGGLSSLRGWQSEMLDRAEVMRGIKIANCQMRAQSLQSFKSTELQNLINIHHNISLQDPGCFRSISVTGKDQKEAISVESEKREEQLILLDCCDEINVTETDIGIKASKLTNCLDSLSCLQQVQDIGCGEWTECRAVSDSNFSLPLTTAQPLSRESGLVNDSANDHYCIHGSLQRTFQANNFAPVSESNSHISSSFDEMNLDISDNLKLLSDTTTASSIVDFCLPSDSPVTSTRCDINTLSCEGNFLNGNVLTNHGFGKSLSNSAVEVIGNTCMSSYSTLPGLAERKVSNFDPKMLKNQSGIASTFAGASDVILNDQSCQEKSNALLDYAFLGGEMLDERISRRDCQNIQARRQLDMEGNVVNNCNVLSAHPNRSRLLSDSSLSASSKERKREEFSCLSADHKSVKGSIPKRSFSLFSRFWRRSESKSSQSSLPATFKMEESDSLPCASNSDGAVSEGCRISSKRLTGNSIDRQCLPSECKLNELKYTASPCWNPVCSYETGTSSMQLTCSKASNLDIVRDNKAESDLIPRLKREKSPVWNEPSPVRLISICEDDKDKKCLKTPVTKAKLATFSIPKFIQGKSSENRSPVNLSNSSSPKQSVNLVLNSVLPHSLTLCSPEAKCLKDSRSSNLPLVSDAVLQPDEILIGTNTREQKKIQDGISSMRFLSRRLEVSNSTKQSRNGSEVKSSIKADCSRISESQTGPSCIGSNKTTNTNRPRSGREYQHIYRNKLQENCGENQIAAPKSSPAFMTSVFTFEWENDHGKSRDDLLKYPSSPCSQITSERSRAYANLSLGRDGSLVISDDQPLCENDLPIVNYAEIDLSAYARDLSVHMTKPVVDYSPTIYAQIDLVATRAASQASLEHARQREDKIDRSIKRSSFRLSSNRAIFRKSSIPTEKRDVADQKNGSFASGKDRKFSPL